MRPGRPPDDRLDAAAGGDGVAPGPDAAHLIRHVALADHDGVAGPVRDGQNVDRRAAVADLLADDVVALGVPVEVALIGRPGSDGQR